MHDYNARELMRLSGLSSAAIRGLVRAGFIQPSRGRSGRRYTFQDLVLLRSVKALRAARIPTPAIYNALRTLRASLPADAPISATALSLLGGRGLEAGQAFAEPHSGQYALDLEVAPFKANVYALGKRETAMHSADAHQHFLAGLDLEETDAAAAQAAYEACLSADPQYPEARINLGRLLHLGGHLAEAEQIYRGSLEPSALLYFNLAIVLEDSDREDEAVVMYRQAIAEDPAMADAHFNVARLHERAGDAQAAFRHLLAYRRLLDQMGT